MDKDTLIQRRDSVEAAFNAVVQKISELEGEKFRLQGEYRLLDSLINADQPVQETAQEVEVVEPNQEQPQEPAQDA